MSGLLSPGGEEGKKKGNGNGTGLEKQQLFLHISTDNKHICPIKHPHHMFYKALLLAKLRVANVSFQATNFKDLFCY